MNTETFGEQTIIRNGSRAVSIVKNAKFEATLYVNCSPRFPLDHSGDRTLVSRLFPSYGGAKYWAEDVVTQGQSKPA
jgi:hypothetical protein